MRNEVRLASSQLPRQLGRKQKIWVDLDNSPHVPFFCPIIDELRARGYELLITARDAYQVRELLEFYKVPARIIGKHHGKSKLFKALGTLWRSLVLAQVVWGERPDISICHGSRSCLLASWILRVPNVTIIDYEFTAKVPLIKPTWLMIPSVIPQERFDATGAEIMKYPGIKEDVYLARFRPDDGLRTRLNIPPDALVVTVRPPATEAHYHNPESDCLLTETLKIFVKDKTIRIILLPRNKRQESKLRSIWGDVISTGQVIIPDHVEDGLNLIWNSDLVISGGGTMNREAAAMGIPVYSIFRGKIGAVDRYLVDHGRLVLLESVQDVRTKIKTEHRHRMTEDQGGVHIPALETIVRNIELILEPAKIPMSANAVKW